MVFKGGENRSTRRKISWKKGENQQQTQPTYVTPLTRDGFNGFCGPVHVCNGGGGGGGHFLEAIKDYF